MKTVTERYAEHGSELRLQHIPVDDDPFSSLLTTLYEAGLIEEADDGALEVTVEKESVVGTE